MESGAQRRIQFINASSGPAGEVTNVRHEARSHSAREAHARARRLRVLSYQSENAQQYRQESQMPDDDDVNHPSLSEVDSEATSLTFRIPGGELADLSSPVSLLSSDRRNPFTCFPKRFTPTEHFLLDYYVRAVIPTMYEHCVLVQYQHSLLMDWLRLSLTDLGSLCAMFLASCRHMSLFRPHGHKFMPLAIKYKLASIRILSTAILRSPSSASDTTVATAMALALDEIALGDIDMARNHIIGAVKMVELNGGPLRLNSVVRFLLQQCIRNNRLFDTKLGLLDAFMIRLETA